MTITPTVALRPPFRDCCPDRWSSSGAPRPLFPDCGHATIALGPLLKTVVVVSRPLSPNRGPRSLFRTVASRLLPCDDPRRLPSCDLALRLWPRDLCPSIGHVTTSRDRGPATYYPDGWSSNGAPRPLFPDRGHATTVLQTSSLDRCLATSVPGPIEKTQTHVCPQARSKSLRLTPLSPDRGPAMTPRRLPCDCCPTAVARPFSSDRYLSISVLNSCPATLLTVSRVLL